MPRLRRNRERVKANPVRSGCGELELAEGVEGAFADFAGDRQPRNCRVASLAGGAVEGEVGGGCDHRVRVSEEGLRSPSLAASPLLRGRQSSSANRTGLR